MRIADTSALYALFSRDDVHHRKAKEMISDPEPILISPEIWSETISLVQYRQGFEMAVKVGSALLELPHVERSSTRMSIIRSSWKIFQNSRGDLSYPDSTVLSWCKDRKATPLTFDGKIQKYFDGIKMKN